MPETEPHGPPQDALKRSLTLPLLVLYGLGVTVGAGIYVLVGVAAAEAGLHAPLSFLLAAFVVSFTGFSYAELSTRFPESAGEAAYARNAFRSGRLAVFVGFLVVIVGLVSSATIAIGASAYLELLLHLPAPLLTVLIIGALGVIAALGVLESVAVAAVLTLVEIAGLVFVVVAGVSNHPEMLTQLDRLVPPPSLPVWGGIASAALVAFFAFVGFEDLANIAEEARNPRRDLPRAILLTLAVAAFIYLVVTTVVVLAAPLEQLQESAAPLSLVFGEDQQDSQTVLNLIAGVATLNGVLIQMIMASRVLFGLARQGSLPQALAAVNPRTRTPVNATIVVVLIILICALALPIAQLAEITSSLVLVIFIIVNLSLVRLKLRKVGDEAGIYRVHMSIPVIGAVVCAALLVWGLVPG